MTDTFPLVPTKEVFHGGKSARAVSVRVQGADRRAARFSPETADRVVDLAGSIDEYEDGFGIGSAAGIGICVLTCATADDLLARVREVKEEESKRARWFEDDPRAGWAEAARELASRGDDGLLDDPMPTVPDESE